MRLAGDAAQWNERQLAGRQRIGGADGAVNVTPEITGLLVAVDVSARHLRGRRRDVLEEEVAEIGGELLDARRSRRRTPGRDRGR